jgi:hypothetical protein
MDVTYPDYSQVNPGQTFLKTWRIQNTGTCTWTPDYAILSQQSGQSVAPLVNYSIPPGASVDVSVSIKAPYTTGLAQMSYLFRARDGSIFGVGSSGITPIWARVQVGSYNIPTVGPNKVRIQFPPGGTSTTLEGTLAANEINYYVLYAIQGQTMSVALTSTKDRAVLSIYGMSDGTFLVNGQQSGATSWQGTLPNTQDYAIDVIGGKKPADYTLSITVNPISPQSQRTRIQFARGATSTTVQGGLAANETDYYVLRASQGQSMTVNVSSHGNNALLTIYGLTDGIPLVRGTASGATSFNGILPLTQDYAIDVTSNGTAVNYNMGITIQ